MTDGMRYEAGRKASATKSTKPIDRGVVSSVRKANAKKAYKAAKSMHKAEIKTLKHQIKQHKLLLKQARLTYKIAKSA